ncbi:MAG TPA: hypothetical protein VFT64_09960 [Rickettsiales bacterium]|nr:hypothetical protein [Rickettsiales bacterium]
MLPHIIVAIVNNIVNFVLAIVLGLIGLGVYSVIAALLHFPIPQGHQQLMQDPAYLHNAHYILFLSICLSTTIVGCIPGHRRIIEGALSSLVFLAIYYGHLIGAEQDSPILEFIVFNSLPFFGMLGAYLRRHADFSILRSWPGAFGAFIVTHYFVTVVGMLCVLIIPSQIVTELSAAQLFATCLAILAATTIMPKALRPKALKVFMALAMLFTIVPIVYHITISKYRPTDLLNMVASIWGCYFAYSKAHRGTLLGNQNKGSNITASDLPLPAAD